MALAQVGIGIDRIDKRIWSIEWCSPLAPSFPEFWRDLAATNFRSGTYP